MLQFDGKVALVTGGSSGIGRASAVAFAKNGARVVVASRRETESIETLKFIEEVGGEGIFVQTDVSDESQVESMVNRTVEAFGRLDFAFNNAGTNGYQNRLHTYSRATWNNVIAVNLTGVFLCMQYEIKHMLTAGGGSIVNTASINGMKGIPGNTAYSVSKWGVIGMTKGAAKGYGADGIRVNAVSPGLTDTPMVAMFTENEESSSHIRKNYPMGRIADADEVADAVMWLNSDAASFITGVSLPVDGGFTA